MKCLRCGRDTATDRVFCEECTQNMDQYPVNSNIPVILPKRTQASVPKKTHRKKTVSLEDQVLVLKGHIRLLLILLAAMTIFASLLVYPAVKYLMDDQILPGQNYTSIVSKTSDPSEPK